MKKYIALLLLVLVAVLPVWAGAEGKVAKVTKDGVTTEYATINEAITAWTNNSTLTLLADVNLSNVITLKSTEYHILDLGEYTMTAASKKDAIQIENNGRSSASYTLDIKADATNPGGITATGKAIVRTAGKSGVTDRPITRFYNGIFTASNIVSHSGSNGARAPHFYFYGGEYNGTISTNRTLNQFYGGTFHGNLHMSVDSSAYTLIAGGTFKQLSNSFGSALNSGKFTIGSAKGVFDKEVYVDENGYYVVAAARPAEGYEASVAKNPGSNEYLAYSMVKNEGKLNYADANVALSQNESGDVTIYVDKLDLIGTSFKGTLLLPEEDSNLTVTFAEGTEPAWTVETELSGKTVTYTEIISNGVVTRVYNVQTKYTVNHCLQNADDDEYTTEQEVCGGTAGEDTQAAAKTYTGFRSKSFEPVKVKADGSTVINIYYDREVYKLTIKPENGEGDIVKDVRYGAKIVLPNDLQKKGHVIAEWLWELEGNEVPGVMPLHDVTVTAKWEKADGLMLQTLVRDEFTDEYIPETLKLQKLDTVEKIENTLLLKAKKALPGMDGAELTDVALIFSVDGGNCWYKADEGLFPEDGRILVRMPVPEGTDPALDTYHVVHMFTMDAFGHKPGEMEEPEVSIVYNEKGEPMLSFYLTGLSPVLVTWERTGGDLAPPHR